ncbi:MAG: HAD-IIB family hydrolase [Alphaproteobacteria bacterium]|nr:HAD-IIB family hydrolase [Alphaproteobacteria bacterium]
MNIYVFDMDGTLTPARQPMQKDFSFRFLPWLKSNLAYIAAGSNYEKLTEQLPPDVVSSFSGIFSSMGNVYHKKGVEIYKNEIKLDKEMLKSLERFRKTTTYDGKLYNNYMELRPGMLNFSVLGRNCPFSEREKYHEWDNIHHEREKIAKYMNDNFKDYDFSLGGKISIDIVPKGFGKEQIAHVIRQTHPNDKIIFIGDRVVEGGNDYTLAQALHAMENTEVVAVENPEGVLEYLNL